ncbi:radical SAM protein [Nocardiopsis sp. FR26]|nr:radical SAM protein [Nocardiopsis sp. FR26]
MLTEITGIHRIRMLYLQLLYRCNFSCRHCFHGELLADPEHYTLEQAQTILRRFRDTYQLEAVTLLGGEPLLYRDIVDLCRYAKNDLGLRTEMCSNAHRGFRNTVTRLAPVLDKFRVSLDGLADTHDRIRQRGSFTGAIEMIDHARNLDVPTSATMTVTAHNLDQIVPLARLLQQHGVTELKLHALRLVGNAVDNPDLEVASTSRYGRLHEQIAQADLDIAIIYDSDLSPAPAGTACSNLVTDGWLDRIESDPRGGLTVSCKAVGRDANAFRWDKHAEEIVHEPRENDEFALAIPDVVYVGG